MPRPPLQGDGAAGMAARKHQPGGAKAGKTTSSPISRKSSRACAVPRGSTPFSASARKVIQEVSAFDRVMIYRFLDDGCGEVVAEHTSSDYHVKIPRAALSRLRHSQPVGRALPEQQVARAGRRRSVDGQPGAAAAAGRANCSIKAIACCAEPVPGAFVLSSQHGRPRDDDPVHRLRRQTVGAHRMSSP